MVRLNHLSCLGTALYDVWIDGTLTEEVNTLKLACLLLKYADKLATDNLTLLLRILNALKLAEETLSSVYIYKVCAELVAEYLNNILALALTHKAMVYVNANEVFANSLKEQCSNN